MTDEKHNDENAPTKGEELENQEQSDIEAGAAEAEAEGATKTWAEEASEAANGETPEDSNSNKALTHRQQTALVKKRRFNRILLFAAYIIAVVILLTIGVRRLFFSNFDSRKLFFYDVRERVINYEKQKVPKAANDKERIKATIEALRDGPKSIRLVRLIPYEASLNEVFVFDSNVLIDFDEVIFLDVDDGSERDLLDSIAFTVFENFKDYNTLRITVNSQAVKHFGGGIDLRRPLYRKDYVYEELLDERYSSAEENGSAD